MMLTTLEAAAAEPVRLADVRAYLRLGGTGEDELVSQLAASARARLEAAEGLALVSRRLAWTLDDWPCGALRLPVRPVTALERVRVWRDGGFVDASGALALEPGASPRVRVAGETPRPERPFDGIEIVFVAGFGPAPEDVDPSLRLAVMRLAAHAYHSREAGLMAQPLPADVDALLVPWRRVRL